MSKQTPKKAPLLKLSINHFFLAVACASIILIAFSIFNLLFYFSFQKSSVLGVKIEIDTKTNLINQETYWVSFLQENPRYIHGWIELAAVEVQLENPGDARIALDNAFAVNPNSKEVKDAELNLGLFGF